MPSSSPTAYVIISIPLLVETSNHYEFDRIMVVDIDEQSQFKRCIKRDNLTSQQIQNIINTQATREQRLAIADDIINNDQPLSSLKSTINQFHQRYLLLSRQELLGKTTNV
jgi:dephospho-CoA kinase